MFAPSAEARKSLLAIRREENTDPVWTAMLDLTVGFKPILGSEKPKGVWDNGRLTENNQTAHGRYIRNRAVDFLTGDLDPAFAGNNGANCCTPLVRAR